MCVTAQILKPTNDQKPETISRIKYKYIKYNGKVHWHLEMYIPREDHIVLPEPRSHLVTVEIRVAR